MRTLENKINGAVGKKKNRRTGKQIDRKQKRADRYIESKREREREREKQRERGREKEKG